MKKILILFFAILICAGSAWALSYPRWAAMPIRVYIPQYGEYSKLMASAFNAWQRTSNNLVRFKFVSKKSEADIYVNFVKQVNCGSESAVGCAHYGPVHRGYYTQNYIEIGMYELIFNSDGSVYGTKPSLRPKSNLYGVMIHEVGHTLGLKHSENKDSIMYPIDGNYIQHIMKSDIQTLNGIYR